MNICSGHFLCAILVRGRLATIAVSRGVTTILGILTGNIEFMTNPVLGKTLSFIFSFTIYYQLAELNGGHPAFKIPFGLTVVTSLITIMVLLLLAARVFCKWDMK